MSPPLFAALFVAALIASLGVELWLARRHARHVAAHREAVPEAFRDRIGLAAHRKAADYTIARTRAGNVETIVDALLLLAFTFGGVLAALVSLTERLPTGSMVRDTVLVVLVAVVSSVVGLPFSWHRTFGIEARFGFNRTTPALWFADLAKGIAIAAVLGLPLVALVLWLMDAAGKLWWLWVWGVWIGFQFLILALYPTVIAPLFNKFSPLPDGEAKEAVLNLLARCGFESRGLYVIDGSKRSAHGNAFFTGFGRAKRIVFYDTLLARLQPDELEAVLAHELGHFRLHHVVKRMLWMAVASLAFLALLAWLMASPWFYAALGVPMIDGRPGIALVLFVLVLPVFAFVLSPLSALYSRRHEFEADAFAADHASAAALTRALVKLYEDNAATLTPDPLHSAFHDSHPPAVQRIARLASPVPAAPAAG